MAFPGVWSPNSSLDLATVSSNYTGLQLEVQVECAMKRVLWITSFFPPRVNVATIRSVKFLKYLPRFGWEATVVCPHEDIKHTEASRKLLEELSPSVTISHMLRDPFQYVTDRKEISGIARSLGYFMNNVIPPDGHLYWAFLALPHIEQEIARHKPDLVYTTCSPFSINLIGAWVKHKHQLPWVTDFRDLWTLSPVSRRFLNTYHSIVSKFLERSYLECCDALIVNTENSRSRMVEKYPMLRNKIEVIPNGFDPDDIQLSDENHLIANSFFYSGTINEKVKKTPLPMLRLLSDLADSGHMPESWELHYVGGQGEVFTDLVRRAGIRVKYETHGYLDHVSYYQFMQCMAYILFCMPSSLDTRSWIPARLYDYIGNRKRIICLASRDSEVARLLERYGNSLTLFYDEHIDVQAQKLRQYLSDQQRPGELSEEFIRRFSRKELAGQLTRVFQQVTSPCQIDSRSTIIRKRR
jgi:glycosyltransferase involved in cell wall biosynthesis